MKIPAEYFEIPRAYKQFSIPMSWGCCCAANQGYDGRLPDISVEEGEAQHDPWEDQQLNPNDMYFEQGLGKPFDFEKLDKSPTPQGQGLIFNSTQTRLVRNGNIYSAKEEALYIKSHSSLKSRKSSFAKHGATPSSRKKTNLNNSGYDLFAGGGSQAKNQHRKNDI